MKRLLVRMLSLFPRSFRERFGTDMAEQIERDYEDARSRSRLSAALFTLGTAVDVARASAAEHTNPTVPVGRPATTEGTGDRQGDGTMKTMLQDLRIAGRSLRRTPGFTMAAVGTLGLAVGVLTAVFAVVDTVLLDPLPYPEPDRLVMISASAPGSDFPPEFGVSLEFFVQYREQSELLEDLSTVDDFTNTFRTADRVERVRMSTSTSALFRTLDVEPILGRTPQPDDEGKSLVLSEALWSDWFGRDPEIIGRSFDVMGSTRTVIAVMGGDFDFPREDVLLWVPNEVRAEDITPGRYRHRLVGRMAPGADVESLEAELDLLASRLPERFGGSANYARLIERHRSVVRTLEDDLLGPVAGSIWILFGAMTIVVLIACANVTNLLLVRAERRRRDLAVRRAMGAGRGRLVRAQLVEAGVVSLLSGVVAVAIARFGLPLLIAAAPGGAPRLSATRFSATGLAFTVVVCALAALLCGLVPALRSASVGLGALREGSRGSTTGKRWARDGLVVAQTAMALVLLVGSGLLLRSFQELRGVDPGYDTDDVFTFQMAPERDDLVDGPSWTRFHLDFMGRLRALPGVESVGIVENVPLNESVASRDFLPEDRAGEEDGGVLLSYTAAGGEYFATMGIEVVRGRIFDERDQTTNLGNVVISQSAADVLWPGGDPIGRRLQWQGHDTWETVIGVVQDVMQDSFRDEPEPLVYIPMQGQRADQWWLSSPGYVVKTDRVDEIGPEIRALIREVAPSAPMYRTFTMDALAADSMVELSFMMLAVAVAAALALLLGMVGLYGVLSFVVAQRTREIGVRMALGAEAGAVRRMVVAQGARVVVWGVLVGAAVALVATRFLRSMLYGVGPIDPLTYALVSAIMLGVGLLASYLPARRASGVDPVESLRTG